MLTALRYLGRGSAFDDLEESTAVSLETIWQFFLQFIKYRSSTVYDEFVQTTNTKEELKRCEREFAMAGLPGCVGSSDATHVLLEFCIFRLRQLHLGYKLAHTARTYNMNMDHKKRILSTTKGHPARFNDKTLVLYDEFVQSLHKNHYGDKFSFFLKAYDINGDVIEVKFRGCYLLVDNGYLNWSRTLGFLNGWRVYKRMWNVPLAL